ncbi:MAG: hypothetical protein EO766_12115 [Hydrotalea sp. AMD]|uniref:hypothetical protein n=1 Tax=Hydrotalea sp. AMD TaxID=2501297 RepID=UPI001026E7EC|nr:hypothetical protein [Hydrotalea sp. AMD]RWZ87263.1 MAG: hypothetical protein EO766_12115 [Hydrotalea sp. AMD]
MSNKLRSSIFLSDLSVVDHGYINDEGQVIGGSFNPGFIITGEVDEVEKVVVDFSTIKKDVKGLIDRHLPDVHDNGFDHKLWFIEGYSLGELTESENGDRWIISTPAVEIDVPTDALRFISFRDINVGYTPGYIGDVFAEYLEKHLSEKYSNINIKVECFNNVNTHTINKTLPLRYFSYSHGLKDSTSYGCQNIAHGHLSFVQYKDSLKAEEIAHDLDNAVFINSANISNETDDTITISYRTPRGWFNASYNKELNHIIVLETETTIEYIGEYVKNKFNVTDFYISEGLSKGTYIGA